VQEREVADARRAGQDRGLRLGGALPERVAEPQDDLQHRTHRQAPDRVALRGRERGTEPNRAQRGRLGLQHAERQRHQRGPRAYGRELASHRAARPYLDTTLARPQHVGRDRAQAQAARLPLERTGEVHGEAIVPVDDASDAAAGLARRSVILLHQPRRAHPPRIGGVEPLDERARQRPHVAARGAAQLRPAADDVRVRAILARQPADQRLGGAPRAPVTGQFSRLRGHEADRVRPYTRARRAQRRQQRRRVSVHELRPSLDGRGPPRRANGVDAPAHARPRLDHHHLQPRPQQPARRLEPRDAGAQCHDVHDVDGFSLGGRGSRHGVNLT
jgi:hypothetical protein